MKYKKVIKGYKVEDKVQFGEWERDEKGYFYKKEANLDYLQARYTRGIRSFTKTVKHSFYKPDLFMIGDYINGEKIINIIPSDWCGDEMLEYPKFITASGTILAEDIVDYMTKERFDYYKYKEDK